MPDYQISPDLKIHYRDENIDSERVILLLHGLGATGDSWEFQFPALIAAGWRCIAPDLRGFGQSTFPGRRLTIGDLASDMYALLAELDVQRAVVVGISMGGTVALQLALQHSNRIEKLVLVNTFASIKADNFNQQIYFRIRQLLVHTLGLKAQANTVAQRVFPKPEQEFLRQQLIAQILQADIRAYRAAMRALARFDVSNSLDKIECPTLVITGDADTTVLPARQAALVSGIPGAQQVTISGAGHGVSVDHPNAFNQALTDFLL